MPIIAGEDSYVSMRLPRELHAAIEERRVELARQTGLRISFSDVCRLTLAKAFGLEPLVERPKSLSKRPALLRRKDPTR